MQLKKRGGDQPQERQVAAPLEDDVQALGYQALVEFIRVEEWMDGSVRTPGTLLLCWGDGRWRLWLNNRDGSETAWVSSDSLEGVLSAANTGLANGDLEWRPSQERKGKNPRR